VTARSALGHPVMIARRVLDHHDLDHREMTVQRGPAPLANGNLAGRQDQAPPVRDLPALVDRHVLADRGMTVLSGPDHLVPDRLALDHPALGLRDLDRPAAGHHVPDLREAARVRAASRLRS
jgi:hypothetical protein